MKEINIFEQVVPWLYFRIQDFSIIHYIECALAIFILFIILWKCVFSDFRRALTGFIFSTVCILFMIFYFFIYIFFHPIQIYPSNDIENLKDNYEDTYLSLYAPTKETNDFFDTNHRGDFFSCPQEVKTRLGEKTQCRHLFKDLSISSDFVAISEEEKDDGVRLRISTWIIDNNPYVHKSQE